MRETAAGEGTGGRSRRYGLGPWLRLASLANHPGLGAELGGLLAAAKLAEKNGLVLETAHQVWMMRPQALREDREGLFGEWLGLA